MVQADQSRKRGGGRLLARGEGAIASTGAALILILAAATSASMWWAARGEARAERAAGEALANTAEDLLAETIPALLAAGEITTVRRLVMEGVSEHGLGASRLVLPGGRVIADSDPTRISREPVPDQFGEFAAGDAGQVGRIVRVPGRGDAALIVEPGSAAAAWRWETYAGLAAVGAASMACLLLVYRHARGRLRALGAMQEALRAYARGERSRDALALHAGLGDEAQAWNAIIDERDQAARTSLESKALGAIASRGGENSDLTSACDAMWQGMLIVEDSLRIKFANGAAGVYLKAPRESVTGRGLDEFITSAEVIDAVRRVASGEQRQRRTVEVGRLGDDEQGVLRFSVRPVRREDSAAALVMIEDVTQQRVADDARNKFVAHATHELRTPLTNIRLYVDVINAEARRLERIVGEMLSVSEIEAGSLRLRRGDVRVDALMDELRADYDGPAKEKGIDLGFDLPPKLPVIQGDRDKIALAMHNLVGNAIKYTPAGGRVGVRVRVDDSALAFDVADTGIGISETDAARLFERFYRAKDERVTAITGSGLGLALARDVARLHGGDVTFESMIDQGSTFTLTLPMSAAA
jgi:signal transduction histidine kinase